MIARAIAYYLIDSRIQLENAVRGKRHTSSRVGDRADSAYYLMLISFYCYLKNAKSSMKSTARA